MKQLAQTAVTQYILYEQGEYAPRADLMAALDRWMRLHTLMRTRICPASREAPVDASLLEAALALLPVDDPQRPMLARCAARHAGDACPLEREPALDAFALEEGQPPSVFRSPEHEPLE
jgi:hypothetical protein